MGNCEQRIQAMLEEHQALTEGEIYKLLDQTDVKEHNDNDIIQALGNLCMKDKIEIVRDPTDTIDVFRMKRTWQ